jgi:site-specific DNA-methyltransferase (adenine-specific)
MALAETLQSERSYDTAPLTAGVGQRIICGDCLRVLPGLGAETVDVVVTSVPYNLGIKYRTYQDDLPREQYLKWLGEVFMHIKRVLKNDGSFFLNVGYSNVDPWISVDVAGVARPMFVLQNRIVWVKSITVGGQTAGHFKPINSGRFLTPTCEDVFHFTKNGDVQLDRLAVGVPYADKTNVVRWRRATDLRCRGNSWFVPYETVTSGDQKGRHPAAFPVELAEWCIKLHGVKPGMTILDPFVGIGSALVAAKRLKVDGIGIEIDPAYVAFAMERIENACA